MKKLLVSLILISLFIFNIGFGKENLEKKEVIVLGMGSIFQGDKAKARDMAIEDGLRRAVEKVLGTFIEAETIVENFQIIEDKIYTQSRGYIKNYQILNEYEEEDLYKVELRAVVGVKKLQDDLDAILLLIRRMRKPRIMVIILKDGREIIFDRTSEGEIIRNFIKKEFYTVDTSKIEEVYKREEIKRAVAGDNDLVAKIGKRLGAEVVVVGRSKGEKMAFPNLGGLISFRAFIEVKAIRCDVGSIIAAEGSMASGVDITEETACRKALIKSCKKLTPKLISKILEAWEKETSKGRMITLKIKNISFQKLLELEKILRNEIRGISDLYRRSFSEEEAIIEIDSKYDAQSLASEISRKDFGFSLYIVGFSANKIELKVE